MTYDFTLTSGATELGFNVAISKERPYERATAQFRKEQFDSTPTVGDQSLTGWWTRGQLSFHKGGGVTYYEVLEGETVLDRFDSAKGVNPFTPGQVTIGRAWNELDTGSVGIEDAVKVFTFTAGDVLACRGDDGNAYTAKLSPLGDFEQITTVGSSDVAYVASSRTRAYFAVGDNIEVWVPGDAASTVLWTGTLDEPIKGLWYAKQRLWVVDGHGKWYVLSTAGGTFNSTDDDRFTIKDYTYLISTTSLWSVVDSPGPVYIGAYNEVYAVSVEDEGGLLPTIGTPVLMVELPENEYIYCMGYTLSTLAMATDQGMRFAAQDGNGGLVYGPRLGFGSFSGAQRMGARATRISTMGEFFDEKGLYSYDLGNLVEPLEPAHVLEATTSSVATLGSTGAINTQHGLVAWSSDQNKIWVASSSEYLETSSIKTGYHRFGTLDSKWFRSVVVRMGGSGGSIEVFRLDPSGSGYTETSLGTIAYPETEADFDLGPDIPAERVALKFVLNRDGGDETKAPVLLGYQLKALPQPKRQRMIRVPLMLFDDETNRSGQRMVADPWDRLSALEALEEGNAVVQFSDNETGETGTAYIETISVERTNPPAAGKGGVGGIIWLVLRKVGQAEA